MPQSWKGNARVQAKTTLAAKKPVSVLSARVVSKTVVAAIAKIPGYRQSTGVLGGSKIVARVAKAPFALPAIDTTPPSIPQNLTVTAHTIASLSLAWNGSSDDISGVKEYSVRRDGVLLATITAPTTTYIDTGLGSGETHSYTVRARDFSNNVSADSNTATGTTDTPATGDTTPPTQPTNLAVTAHTTSSISLSWTESTDNVAVTGYIVTRDGSQVGPTAGTTYTIGPSQAVGRRTIANANSLPLVAGDIVLFEPIATAGRFSGTRLNTVPGVYYGSAGGAGVPWGMTGASAGIDLNGDDIIVEDFDGDGANAAGSQGIASPTQSQRFIFRRWTLANYKLEAIKSRQGQWPNFVATGSTAGTDDADWIVDTGTITGGNAAGVNAWFHYGSGLSVRNVVWDNTGAGDHAFYPKARGLRMYDCEFKNCTGPLSLRCGDQLCYGTKFTNCVDPWSYFPYDKTGLGGIVGMYDTLLKGCTGTDFLFFPDYSNHETSPANWAQLTAEDFEFIGLTIEDDCTTPGGPAFGFRDVTVQTGRNILVRNVAVGSGVTSVFQSGIVWTKVDSDFNAYTSGTGKPASPDDTHSISPSSINVNATTGLPNAGSALLGAGTTTGTARYTPPAANIGYAGSSGQGALLGTKKFTDTGLTAGTTYAYTVIAFDAAGNQSTPSSTVNGTTDSIQSGFVIGPPANWGSLTSGGTGCHRPSLTVFDANARFGPQTSTYYDNATLRSQPRGTHVTTDNGRFIYYPRSLGHDITAITSGTNFVITSAGLVSEGISVGETIVINDLVGTNGNPLRPKPDGTYTVKSISGNNITFNESWTGTGVYNANSPGYAIKDSKKKSDAYYEVNLTQAQIEGGAVCPQTGTVFFRKNNADGYWEWTGGYCNRWIITGNSPGSLKIRVAGNLDVINASPEWSTFGLDGDPQIMNPYCCVQWNAVLADVNGMSCQATTGGTMAYSQPLGSTTLTIHGVNYTGLCFPQGESISYQDCQGLFQGVINTGYFYDAEKMGGSNGPVRWKHCCHKKNNWAEAGGGGHTDCYQLFDLDNSSLAAGEPTLEWVSLQSGGNSMFFLNQAAAGGTGLITNVWAKNCIAWRGNKFCDLAASSNVGARACWVNGDPGDSHKPEPLDFGNGPPNHPYPTGNVIWPVTTDANANLSVDASGNTTPIDRQVIPSGATFTYVN